MKPFLVALAIATICLAQEASAVPYNHEIILDASDTGLNPKHYSFWAIGWSTASRKYLEMARDNIGEWHPMPAVDGDITAIRVGTGQGELTRIRVNSSNPIDGARLYLVLVPVEPGEKVAPPCVTYSNNGEAVQQPTNPGPGANANMWFCNNRQFISQFFEITLLDNNRPMTIDIQVVDGFVYPSTITLGPKPAKGPVLRIGQPLDEKDKAPNNINRQTVFTAYKNFISREPLTGALKTAYLDLLAKSGTTPGDDNDVIANGILSPAMFLADEAASAGSALQTQYDETLKKLFTPGNLIGMRSDDRKLYFRGNATKDKDTFFIDFVAYNAKGCNDSDLNTDHRYRVYSPLTPNATKQGTAAFMVFANTGVFDDAGGMIAGEVGIAKALQRDIVAALNRGMALLPKAQPNTNNTKFGCNAEHTVYWANLTNFYPKNGTYNNYARFAHVAKVANKLLFVAPPTNSTDAQNATMGQSYGFPFDETPGNGATEQPNVPTKFDPVPADTKTATITLGTFGALSLTRSPKL